MVDVELDLDLSQVLEGSVNETWALCLPVGFCYELEAALDDVICSRWTCSKSRRAGQELPAERRAFCPPSDGRLVDVGPRR